MIQILLTDDNKGRYSIFDSIENEFLEKDLTAVEAVREFIYIFVMNEFYNELIESYETIEKFCDLIFQDLINNLLGGVNNLTSISDFNSEHIEQSANKILLVLTIEFLHCLNMNQQIAIIHLGLEMLL